MWSVSPSLLLFTYLSHCWMFESLSTTGILNPSCKILSNPSSPCLPSGLLETHELLPWNVPWIAMGQLGAICYFTMYFSKCLWIIFPTRHQVPWKTRPFLKYFGYPTAPHTLWSPQSLDGMLLKFSIHQDDHRDPENLKDLRERKKKSKVFIKVQAPLNRMTEK